MIIREEKLKKGELPINKIVLGEALDSMRKFPPNSVDTLICDPPYGLSFMGKKWDYDVPSVEIWKEALRVLKSGGTALIFAGSRTQHRMAVNVEDAGFILKDTIMWLYGSGFPKATDISKQLDKGHKRKKIKIKGKVFIGSNNNIKGESGEYEIESNKPVTPEAKLWNGWKSHGLKPAYEPILVAMKPNDGTYANNALKWGVSGLNIDAGRIGTEENLNGGAYSGGERKEGEWKDKSGFKNNKLEKYEQPQGRFPANIILDEEAGKMLDEQTIGKVGNGHWAKTKISGFGKFGNGESEYLGIGKKDKQKGGASRFFYCAKASKKERNAGCEGLPIKNAGGLQGRADGSLGGKPVTASNFHPTVKPLKLMEYLVKLTSMPNPNQVYLDPFMGSGTTGIACKRLGRNFIGIELDPEYIKIAEARINNYDRRK